MDTEKTVLRSVETMEEAGDTGKEDHRTMN